MGDTTSPVQQRMRVLAQRLTPEERIGMACSMFSGGRALRVAKLRADGRAHEWTAERKLVETYARDLEPRVLRGALARLREKSGAAGAT